MGCCCSQHDGQSDTDPMNPKIKEQAKNVSSIGGNEEDFAEDDNDNDDEVDTSSTQLGGVIDAEDAGGVCSDPRAEINHMSVAQGVQ